MNIFFYLTILIILPNHLQAAFIEIQDAGLESLNGLYVQSGTYNNKARFVSDIFQIRFNYDDMWEIRSNTTLYQNATNTDLPPSSGWIVINGQEPPPELYVRPSIFCNTHVFNESVSDTGRIDNSNPVSIQLENAHFAGNDGDIFSQSQIMIENMPSGLTPVITRQDRQTLLIKIEGIAIHHDNINDCSNIIFSFQDSAFDNVLSSSVINAYLSDLSINFIETIYAGRAFPLHTLTQAVSQADHFDIINLAGDIFTEQISIHKSLIINGQSPLLTIIQAAEKAYTATTSVFKIYENCDVTLRNLTIRYGNKEGGIDNHGRLWIENCAITLNQSNYKGGGIKSKGPLLNMSQCTINNNDVTGSYVYGGGGIYIDENTKAVFNNCTISGNRSDGHGGGILNDGILIIDSCTIYNNMADYSVRNLGNGGGIFTNGVSTLKNSILAGNSDVSDASEIYHDFYGEIISDDYNLIEKKEDSTISGDITHCVIGSNPNLKPLAYNGGYLQTHAFDSSTFGPAINSGQTELSKDERGISRPCNGANDMGAYEACTGNDNSPPEISWIPDIQCENVSDPLTLFFRTADPETSNTQLGIHIKTNNSELLSNEQISISHKDDEYEQLIIKLSEKKYGTTTVMISVSDASNLTASTQFQITVTEPFHLDIDADGYVNALSDGLLILYYLNDALETIPDLSKIGNAHAPRNTIEQIKTFLDKGKHLLDIDGNGNAEAMTDGILLLRYLFEINQGEAFINGMFTDTSTRNSVNSVTDYIDHLIIE